MKKDKVHVILGHPSFKNVTLKKDNKQHLSKNKLYDQTGSIPISVRKRQPFSLAQRQCAILAICFMQTCPHRPIFSFHKTNGTFYLVLFGLPAGLRHGR